MAITVKDLYEISDTFTDELQEVVDGIHYANQAINRINTRIGLKLPEFLDEQTAYTALNENWLKTLVDFEDVAIGGGDDGSGGVVDPMYIDQNALDGKVSQIDFRALNRNSDFWW